MYENNYKALKTAVDSDAVIVNISRHRNPDGSLNIAQFKEAWNKTLETFEVTYLWEKGKTPNYDGRDPLQPEPSIVFVPAQGSEKKQGTVIVAHGGGFEIRTGCEGMNVAEYFSRNGFNTAILTYRLRPYGRMDALEDIKRAIRLLRARKDEFGITDKVVCMGFSAGAMLSGNVATHFDEGNKGSDDPVERESCRPDGIVMGYGAFAFAGLPAGLFADPFAKETRNPFFADKKELIYLSPEANITPDTPPMFIWQTNSDDPRHSFTLGQALTMNGVPFEMHLFPEGVHGMALADGHNDLAMNIPHVHKWADLCCDWLRNIL